jgi:thiosulfate/3-mercaptopyruvate sulfurtransferase
VTKDELAARLEDASLTILDVRSAAEYTGVLGAPCDPRQGHIPGARNLDLQELLGLSPAEVRDLVGLAEGAEIVAYCHSGSRSELATQALRSAGYDASNYVGSWHEWSRDETLPCEGDRSP